MNKTSAFYFEDNLKLHQIQKVYTKLLKLDKKNKNPRTRPNPKTPRNFNKFS